MSDESDLFVTLQSSSLHQSNLQRTVIDAVERIYKGETTLSNSMNPAVKILEMASHLAAVHVREAESLTRLQYKNQAISYDDLYHHMSDKDYVGRFALPAVGNMTFLIGYEEVLKRAVPTGLHGISKIVIPRHTEIMVGGYIFTMQYPIEIRVMPHGGLQIVYDGDQESPLYSLATNQADWVVSNHTIDRVKYLRIVVPMQQMTLTSYKAPSNRSTMFDRTYTFDNLYFHTRVFYKDKGGIWREMLTTHSNQYYDPYKPTAVLRVTDGSVNITIPQVYTTTEQITDDVRIDVYTTHGPVEIPLANYAPSEFKVRYKDHDSVRDSIYVAPLGSLESFAIYSEDLVSGGSASMSFNRLRERTIYETLGSKETPITRTEIIHRLEDLGYDVVQAIDNITKRRYIAARNLPIPGHKKLLASMGTMVGRLHTTIEYLTKQDGVINNGERITLTPSVLYEEVNGQLTLVDKGSVDHILAQTQEDLIEQVNGRHFVYTPFHYVLDTTNDSFYTRPYYLDNPLIKNKFFIDENGTVLAYMNTASHFIAHENGRYVLQVLTNGSDAFKNLPDDEVFVQIKVTPRGELRGAFMNGTLVGKDTQGERIYQFDIETNHDIDADHYLSLTSFTMFDSATIKINVPLTVDIDVIFAIKNHRLPGQRTSEIDQNLGHHVLPTDIIGVYHERLSVELGSPLTRLWTRARSALTDKTYKRYDADVPLLHKRTLLYDAAGPVIEVVNGKPQVVVLHEEGDPVLNNDGTPRYQHLAGDVVRDPDGNPVVLNNRALGREIDLVLMDGVYYFATNETDLEYRTYVPQLITEWVTRDLQDIEDRLLDESELFLKPRTTLGMVDVLLGEQLETKIRAEQSITLGLYVTDITNKDRELKQVLTKTAMETYSRVLQNQIVTSVEMIRTLEAALGSDVISIEITNHGPQGHQPVVTLMDSSTRLAIGQKLDIDPDGTLAVKDTITVAFHVHKPA
jgi:hypothetical protein